MQYASLASGSKGNCHALFDGEGILLVDAGISLKQIKQRLEAVDWHTGLVRALAITHEHSDHISALPMVIRRTSWPILVTKATKAAIEQIQGIEIPAARWIPEMPGKAFDWEGWRLLPFTVSHDAVDPVAYRIEVNGESAAIVTDLGQVTALVADHCLDLDFFTLEANHDIQMLRDGDYPPYLKARILSRVGHLSNLAMAELLSKVISSRLKNVLLAHLSEQNNEPDLARFSASEVLTGTNIKLDVAKQREPFSNTISYNHVKIKT